MLDDLSGELGAIDGEGDGGWHTLLQFEMEVGHVVVEAPTVG